VSSFGDIAAIVETCFYNVKDSVIDDSRWLRDTHFAFAVSGRIATRPDANRFGTRSRVTETIHRRAAGGAARITMAATARAWSRCRGRQDPIEPPC
jgi:hypothetical protein